MSREDAAPIDSVILIGFGGPTSPEDVMPFLRRVTMGRGVPESRLVKVAHHYEVVGGRSPYNDLTREQADALDAWLDRSGRKLPVLVGMRNSSPTVEEALEQMRARGLRHAAGVILAAHRSDTSWYRYQRDVDRAFEMAGASCRVSWVAPWFDDGGFLQACAGRLEEATGLRRGAWPSEVPIVFTAHSIPSRMASASPYVEDLRTSCEGVARILDVPAGGWRLAYQSRSGDGRESWLEPDVTVVLRELSGQGARQVAVEAIGFLVDHVEVLYDLDVEAARLADSLGLRLKRAACVGAHPAFVAMLGERVLRLAATA